MLYLAGERLVPGSVVQVDFQGSPLKWLPATFSSSELLGVYVNLTLPGDYDFRALAPDGTLSSPARVTVQAGSPAALFGLTQPDVQMVFPPSPDTNFAGTVWLMGDGFVPGSSLIVQAPGLPPLPAPLTHVNDQTVAWLTATLLPGDYVLHVVNPTLQVSQSFTLTVNAAGTSPATAAGLPAPQVVGPGSVAAPFVGTVRLYGAGILPGATVEMRPAGSQAAASTALISVSTAEAWWTLVYPQPGSYEVRVVNPDSQATGWWTMDVR
jgi:hypothetical protein